MFEAAVARGVRCRGAYAVWLADVRMEDPCGYQNQSIESVSDTVRTNSSTETRKTPFRPSVKEIPMKPARTILLVVLTFGLGYTAAAQKVKTSSSPARSGVASTSPPAKSAFASDANQRSPSRIA